MGLEVANFISELIATNPIGPSDLVDKGDDHIRLVKEVLQGTFPNANAAINPTPAQFNLLVGLTGTIWTSANDGAGSGLDADLLDAQEGAYYLDLANGTGSMTDDLHGTRAGGTLHADVTTSVDGFMLAVDKIKLDGIETAATADQTKADIDALGIAASTAATWLTGRTITLTGAVTGASAAFNGSANLSFATTLPAASISQAKLKTTTGDVLTNNSSFTHFILPGGSYGFYPALFDNSGSVRNHQAQIINASSGPALNFASSPGSPYISLLASAGTTITARQRYVQASPPYDLGDGEILLFVFLAVDALNNIIAMYIAPEAPWHYNGPTDIRATRRDEQTGHTFHIVKDLSRLPESFRAARASKKIARIRAFQEALAAAPMLEEELTQQVKNADMNLIRHPFVSLPAGSRIIMLDPVSSLMEQFTPELLASNGDSLGELLTQGYVQFGNAPLVRATPSGVQAFSLKWRNTGG